MWFLREVLSVLKRYFLSGVLVVVPLILTYLVLKFLFDTVDGILQPLLLKIFSYSVPGLGIFTTVLIIILAGMLTRNFIGNQLYRLGDRLLAQMPIIRPIYTAAKQLLEAMAMPSLKAFNEVVMVEYPRKGGWSLGFVANRVEADLNRKRQKLVSVFIPSTPTPITGMVVLLPEEEVVPVRMSVEEAVKFLVSGGAASPGFIERKESANDKDNEEVISETR